MRALIDRLGGVRTIVAYAGLGFFLAIAVSQSYGLRFVVVDLLRVDGYSTDHLSQMVARVHPLRDRIPDGAEVYFVKSHAGENVVNTSLKLSALQHTLAPRIIHGVVWVPSKPFEMDTRSDVESRGIALQELYRFPDGGLVLCSCSP